MSEVKNNQEPANNDNEVLADVVEKIQALSKRCICCSVDIPPIDYNGGDTPWTGMWNGGIVDRIAANYGSILDGNIYVIAVCDSCIKQKEADGIVQYTSNYMQ